MKKWIYFIKTVQKIKPNFYSQCLEILLTLMNNHMFIFFILPVYSLCITGGNMNKIWTFQVRKNMYIKSF